MPLVFGVVNFGTARTLSPHRIGSAAVTGGEQMVFLGHPQKTSAFFTIPHAGLRLGLAKGLDVGLRLAPIPLPFASVGPRFGVNLDMKICFTNSESKIQFAIVLGAGGAHVLIQNNTRLANSPNAAILASVKMNDKTQFTVMGRFVSLAIPTAFHRAKGNFVNISKASFGLKRNITESISILPEVGVYWYEEHLKSARASGPGFQFGVMLSTTF